MVLLSGRFSQFLGASSKDSRRIRLGNGEGYEDPDGGCEDELDPVEPSPAFRVAEEASDLLSVSKIFDTLDYSNESY